MSRDRKKATVDPQHARLSIVKQCDLLDVARSTYYRAPKGESAANLALMGAMDRQFIQTPWCGSRMMARCMRRQGWAVGRKRVRRLMRKMGLTPVYSKPNTSKPNPQHRIYPYLLRGVRIDQPNQVWCADITYIPMRRGFLYLVAIMDWANRKVLSWRLANTLDADFCVDALNEALERFGTPSIFNTDQGSQFTSLEFTEVLKKAGIRISMDGKGRWMDNVMIERLWRSLKYECVYLNAFENGTEARRKIENWINYYNEERPHSSLEDRTPNEAYDNRPRAGKPAGKKAA